MTSNTNHLNKYWLSFGVICLSVLAFVFALGLLDRDALASLIKPGGTIESLPFVFLVLAGFTSFAVASRTKKVIRWLSFGAFCLFLAGEEAAWGSDSTFGWIPLPERVGLAESLGLSRPDLHNAISSEFKHLLFGGVDPNLPAVYWYVSYAAIVLFAGGFLVLSLFLGAFGRDRLFDSSRLRRLRIHSTSTQFFVAGFGFMIFANVDFYKSIGLEYMPGIWPLEETYELLGSIAFLYVPLVKLG